MVCAITSLISFITSYSKRALTSGMPLEERRPTAASDSLAARTLVTATML